MKSKISKTEDPTEKMNSVIGDLDALRGSELEYSKNLLQVKNKNLVKERDRLVAKYGKDYPEVKNIDLRLSQEEAVFPAIDKAIQQAGTKQDPFNPTGWRINGYAVDSKGTPVKAMNVLLADQKGNVLRTLPFGCTDDKGYYVITLSGDQITGLKNANLFLAVICKKKKLQVVSKEPFKATAGRITYQDIVLNENECEPPFPDDGNDNSATG